MLFRSLKDVSIQYGEKPVCRNVSFTVERGDRIVLQGKNGSGKSSLLKLLCGEDIPHSGEVRIGSGLTISVVAQDSSHLTGRLSDLARNSGIDESLFLAILSKLDVPKAQMEPVRYSFMCRRAAFSLNSFIVGCLVYSDQECRRANRASCFC